MGRFNLDMEFTNGNYYLTDILEIAVVAEESGNISGRQSRRGHRRRLQAAPVLAGRSHPNGKFFFQRFSSLLANAVCT